MNAAEDEPLTDRLRIAAADDVTCTSTAAEVVFVWPTEPTENGASENARVENKALSYVVNISITGLP